MIPSTQPGTDRALIHKRIRSQSSKLLLQVLLVFGSLGAIAFIGWVVGTTQASVFRIPDTLLDDGEPPVFDKAAIEAFPSSMEMVTIEPIPEAPAQSAWAAGWRMPSGLAAKLWAVDSFGLERRRSRLTGMDPEERAVKLADSIVSDWTSTHSDGATHHQREFVYRNFHAVERYSPATGSFIAMRNGRFVVQVTSSDSIGYESALQSLSEAGLIHPPILPTTRTNRFRLNQDLWAIGIALLGSILWMWQITTSGTRAARLPVSANPSSPDSVAEGLRTLVGAHPALEATESGDGRWSLVVHGDIQDRHLLSNEASNYRHEFRIRLRDHKAVVVESVKAKSRSSDGKSVTRGKEHSRIVPMIDIPGGTPPIAPSPQGFRVVLDNFEPSDLRYALAYYFQLHGWGWEPRLF